jgi:hypothetical protein
MMTRLRPATFYRIVISTRRLWAAGAEPVDEHAMILGYGRWFGLAGLAVTWNQASGPGGTPSCWSCWRFHNADRRQDL